MQKHIDALSRKGGCQRLSAYFNTCVNKNTYMVHMHTSTYVYGCVHIKNFGHARIWKLFGFAFYVSELLPACTFVCLMFMFLLFLFLMFLSVIFRLECVYLFSLIDFIAARRRCYVCCFHRWLIFTNTRRHAGGISTRIKNIRLFVVVFCSWFVFNHDSQF